MSTSPALNVPIKVVVASIALNVDNFRNKEGVTMYCHVCSLLLADGQTDIKAQICLDTQTLPYFDIGDKIEVMLTNFIGSKQVPYTFKFIDMVTRKGQLEIKGQSASAVSASNPMIAGTVADRSLALSVALYSNVKLPAGKFIDVNLVVNTANIFKDYLKGSL